MALTPTTVAPSVGSDVGGSGSTSEGIRVHGAWTVEVRESDGTVSQRVEFHNDLLDSGETFLLDLLSGEREFLGDWAIVLTDGDLGVAGGTTVGTVVRPRGGNSSALRLSYSVTSPEELTFDGVQTQVLWLEGGLPTGASFTGTSLPEPVLVAANQTVYVEVDISFS